MIWIGDVPQSSVVGAVGMFSRCHIQMICSYRLERILQELICFATFQNVQFVFNSIKSSI